MVMNLKAAKALGLAVNAANSSRSSAARRHGRSRRARSRATACGASACWCRTTKTIPMGKLQVSAFTHALAELGWTDGRNVRMDLRWGGGDADRMRALAQELVGLGLVVMPSPPPASTRT
jgi:hypothetical protein